MAETGTQLKKEEPQAEIIGPEKKEPAVPPSNLMDLLMTAAGKELGEKALDAIKGYAEIQAKTQLASSIVLAAVVAAALFAATFLAYYGKFDGAIGTLVGTLVGFLVGRKSVTGS